MYERFVQLLQEKNITPYRVSKETGVKQTTLSDWKTGRATPKTATLQKIADYFNVSVDWLTGKSQFRNNSEIGEYYSDWGNYEPHFNPPFDFCSLLEPIRKEQGYSVDDMANSIGTTAEQYLEYEEGIAPITYAQAEKLCALLATDVSQVLFDNDHYDEIVPEEYHDNVRGWELMKHAAENEAMREAYADEDIKIVARHLEDIPSDKRGALIETINSTIKLYKEAMGLNRKED